MRNTKFLIKESLRDNYKRWENDTLIQIHQYQCYNDISNYDLAFFTLSNKTNVEKISMKILLGLEERLRYLVEDLDLSKITSMSDIIIHEMVKGYSYIPTKELNSMANQLPVKKISSLHNKLQSFIQNTTAEFYSLENLVREDKFTYDGIEDCLFVTNHILNATQSILRDYLCWVKQLLTLTDKVTYILVKLTNIEKLESWVSWVKRVTIRLHEVLENCNIIFERFTYLFGEEVNA